jgi:hypothetical protein
LEVLTMDIGKPITNFDIEALNTLGGRLFDHAESIAAEILLEPKVADLRCGLSSRVITPSPRWSGSGFPPCPARAVGG